MRSNQSQTKRAGESEAVQRASREVTAEGNQSRRAAALTASGFVYFSLRAPRQLAGFSLSIALFWLVIISGS